MNAPEPVTLSQMDPSEQRNVMLVCRDGAIEPLRPGIVLLPSEIAQKRMEGFWQSIFPPKPTNLPRLIELTVTFHNVAILPWGVVGNAEVGGEKLRGWLKEPKPSTGQTADTLLQQCFQVLSARGFDALQVPLPEGRGCFGLVPLSLQQVEMTGQALDMKRSSHGCMGYRWVWHPLSAEEKRVVSEPGLAPA